ncbi:hypothetical protein KC19_2G090700 [Ceratodon purpureus]|uniref:RING-type E3 ubiquitin transferase n=1 Tax=Ceratodon purpureus TaxID=3225 RepID=A0A8T0IRS8_CERPU|nr:hypothetical protein KC19_2G090700 [Ceratodon purpureus]
MSGGGGPCGPPGMQTPDCASPGGDGGSYGNGSGYGNPPPAAGNSYVVNSKIMVVAVAVLFGVVVFILCLHVYAKWFWRNRELRAPDGHGNRQGRTGSWRRRRRRDARVQNPSAPQVVVQSVGLEKAVIEALPTFEFDGDDLKGGALECAVCLEDFESGEKGRTLPKCGHHFHLDCVDMWLYSHSTCPLCRASVRPDGSKPTDAATVAVTIDEHSQPQAPIIGDVQAPFMAAMRASRRQRQRSRSSSQLPTSLNSPTGSNSLPSIPSDLTENPVRNDATESSVLASEPQETSQATPTPAVDPKALVREYEMTPGEIPSNVLFWGDQSHMSTTGAQGPQPSASSIRAPFQVTIDIPRLGQRDASALHPANVVSPMARASASFRRLLSRGKSVVSPHDDDGLDEGGPSSNSPRTPPPPPNAS